MSGIAGIFHFDGRPLEARLLRRMTSAMAGRGPDGADQWVRGPVGLGHVMLHTTPESLREQQPLTDESGVLCLTLDGRVDNRAELRKALESKGARLRSDTDAELVLQAYTCWGEECPARIIGDFAFAIWDQRNQQLFCARDIMGLKPFYYYADEKTFLCASELHAILENPAVPRAPNEGMIAEYLVSSINLEETLYQGIYRLPRAHALVVRPDGVTKSCYWDVCEAPPIRYRTDAEYADHFFDIFQEAVRCRLRSYGPVGAELSGGLDSSAVVSVARTLYRQGSVNDSGFETFSLVFPWLDCDESTYINEVVQHCGICSNQVPAVARDASDYAAQILRHGDFPDSPTTRMHDPLMALAQQKGVRVLLGGDGGDQLLLGSPFYNADLLRRFRIGDAIRRSRMDSQIFASLGTQRSPLSVFLRHGLWPLLPGFVRNGVRRGLNRDGNGIPDWIGAEFARRTRVAERLQKQASARVRFMTVAQREGLASQLDFPWYCMANRHASSFGLEYRSPFLDRRMLEYCVTLPEEQRRRGSEIKFVLRQAMMGLLPELVRNRQSKARFTGQFPPVFEGLGGERFFDSLAIASLGWVDGQRVREMYQQMATSFAQNDPGYARNVWPLWMVCGTELWLRTAFEIGVDYGPRNSINFPETKGSQEKLWKEPQKTESCSHAKAS